MAFNDFQLLSIFAKQSILDVWQGSEYASRLLKLFCPGSKRDTQKCLLYIKLIIVFTPNLEFFPYSEVIQYMVNIQANKSITKIKENYSIWCFWSLLNLFHSNVPANKCHRQKWCVLFFTRIKLVACVLACVHAITRIKWRRLLLPERLIKNPSSYCKK